MRLALSLIALTFVASLTNTAANAADLGADMVKSCTADTAKYCDNKKSATDAEYVWKCLEFKAEKLHKKVSDTCNKAHELYEAQYHVDDSNEANARMPAQNK